MASEGHQNGKNAVNDERRQFRSDLEVAAAIGSFVGDPPDNDFQRGYLMRLKEIFVEMQRKGGATQAL